MDPISSVRTGLQTAIRGIIVGPEATRKAPVRDLSRPIVGDPGLFGPDSITWRVHADSSLLIGGIRTLLLQTMHPLVMAGVADHSDYRKDTLGRLARTATFVGVTTFGTTDEAKAAVAGIRRVHNRIVGHAPDGRPYAANDPHLLSWVHHTMVESFLLAYQRYGSTKLSADDADRYVAEESVLAALIGCENPAKSVSELKAVMKAFRPELAAGSQARKTARFLVLPPAQAGLQAARVPYALLMAAAVGLLPGWVRWDLRVPYLPLTERIAVRPAAKLLSTIVGWAMSAPVAA